MKRIALGLALVVLFGILAEAATRLAGGNVSGIAYDTTLGWRFLKKHHARGGPSFNSQGFRDAEHAKRKAEGVTRVLLLGDSFTAGVNVADNRTFRALTEVGLGKDFEVMAGAVSAWATDQELLYLKEEGLKYEPDIVVLLFAPNDIRENYGKDFFRLEKTGLIQNPPPAFPETDRLAWTLLNHSTFFHAFQKKFVPRWDTFEIIFRNFPLSFPLTFGEKATDRDLFRKDYEPELENAWGLSLALVDEARRRTEESGAKFVLVGLPNKREFAGWLPPEHYEPGRVARALGRHAAETGMAYMDLYTRLAATPDPLRIFLTDGFHFNDVGHAWVASQLEGFLKQEISSSSRLSALPSPR